MVNNITVHDIYVQHITGYVPLGSLNAYIIIIIIIIIIIH